MGLKFGYRKLGITPREWMARNTVFVKTAGGKFGPRKMGGAIEPDPALGLDAPEVFEPPKAQQIGKLPLVAAQQAVRQEVASYEELLASELNDRPKPRKTVLGLIRDGAQAAHNSIVVELVNGELEKLAAAEEEVA